MRYRSKVDAWLVVVLGLPFVGVPLIGISLVIKGGETLGPGLAMLGTWLVVAILGGVLSYPIEYVVDATVLRIRSGVLRTDIPIASITSVRPTHNPLSAPALSLDRLAIAYAKGGQPRLGLVSPKDKTAFLQELSARDPGLRLEGDGLVRD